MREPGCWSLAYVVRRPRARPMRYGPARDASLCPFQLSVTSSFATSWSIAAWTVGIMLRQSTVAALVLVEVASARATSLGQMVLSGPRIPRSLNVASCAFVTIASRDLGAAIAFEPSSFA